MLPMSAVAQAGHSSTGTYSSKTPATPPPDDDDDDDVLIAKLRKTWTSLFDICLNGDDDESVEIYDDCDEIRSKIDEYLLDTGAKKAPFLRDIAHAGWPANPPKIQGKQLNDFLVKDGETAGSTSKVFYGTRACCSAVD
jgi:hypothetical protein